MGLGTDIIEIERIKQAYARNPQIIRKILSPKELEFFELLQNEQRQIEFLAGRFCVKEAYSKALGTGLIHPLKMAGISVLNDKTGRPVLSQGPILDSVLLSISHSHSVAMATCLIDLSENEIKQSLLEKGFKL